MQFTLFGRLPRRPAAIIAVLGRYHDPDAPPIARASLSAGDIDYLYCIGLAGAVLGALRPGAVDDADSAFRILREADATARVLYRQLCETAIDVLRLARDAGIPVALIKGISIADEHYARPHDRIMGDVDVLVPEAKAELLFEAMLAAGFRSVDAGGEKRTPQRHHHLPALRNPTSDIALEIHTALFSRTLLTDEPMFEPGCLMAKTVESSLGTEPCRRFPPQFQLLYTVAHWAIDYKWPANLVSINDVLLLLRRCDADAGWEQTRDWLERNPVVRDMFAVLLTFLRRAGLAEIPAALASTVDESVRNIGKRNVRILHWLMIKFPFSGRRKVGWMLTQANARVVWLTLLEPRARAARLPVAAWRIVTRRTRGKSLLGSTAGRIRTLLQPNE